MKARRMADNVLAAFLSAFFSCVFFFFFFGCWCNLGPAFAANNPFPPPNCFGMIFALSGIRISGICDGRRVTCGDVVGTPVVDGNSRPMLFAESTRLSNRERKGVNAASSAIILMEGAASDAPPPPSKLGASAGNRIRIVYTCHITTCHTRFITTFIKTTDTILLGIP